VAIEGDRAAALCLDDGALLGLHELAGACERSFPGPQDLEWASAGGALVLLQRRPITARAAR
jgi:pyruvate,water dikinase